MTVSPAIVVLSVAIGLPLLLLALGVLYHARVLSRQAASDELVEHVGALATESTEELLLSLQEAVERMQGQIAHQRQSLASLLSEARPVLASTPAAPTAAAPVLQAPPLAAGEDVSAAPTPARDLRAEVQRLSAEGLSDRSIARQLHIGLEEVRIARMRGGRS